MLYGTPQAGNNPDATKNIAALQPGAQLVLLDGTEAVASGSKSVAFSLAFHEAGGFPVTFNLTGCPGGSTIDIQVAADDVEAEYTTIATIGLTAGNGAYTDGGASPYRRVSVTALVGGDVPKMKVAR